MGYDLYNWHDQQGSGVTDVPASAHWRGGPIPTNPSTPAIADVNNTNYWNQIVAAVNNRVYNYNNAFGTVISLSPYWTIPSRPSVAQISALQTAINNIRNQEGFASYVFTTTHLAVGQKELAIFINECRKALRIAGIQTIDPKLNAKQTTLAIYHHYTRIDNPTYGTHIGEHIDDSFDSGRIDRVGKVNPNSTNMERYRCIFNVPIPSWFNTGSASSMKFNFSVGTITQTLEAFNFQAYISNTDDHIYNGSTEFGTGYNGYFYNLNRSQGTLAPVVGLNTFNLVDGDVRSRAGHWCSIILGQQNELAGSGSGISSALHSFTDFNMVSIGNNFANSMPQNMQLVIDWGT